MSTPAEHLARALDDWSPIGDIVLSADGMTIYYIDPEREEPQELLTSHVDDFAEVVAGMLTLAPLIARKLREA